MHGLYSESEIDGFFFDVEPFDTTLRLKVPDRQVTLSINVLERVSGETGRISLAKQLGAAAASGLWGSTPSVYPPMDRQRNREAQPASKSTVCLAAAGRAFTGSAAYVLLPQAFATAAIIITLAHFLTLLVKPGSLPQHASRYSFESPTASPPGPRRRAGPESIEVAGRELRLLD